MNTKGNKRAKMDYSSLAFTTLIPIVGGLDVGDVTGLVVTGSNGAWGKDENIQDISYTPLLGNGVYEVKVTYKNRGFNPVPV